MKDNVTCTSHTAARWQSRGSVQPYDPVTDALSHFPIASYPAAGKESRMRPVPCAELLREEGEHARRKHREGFRKAEKKAFTKKWPEPWLEDLLVRASS